MTGKGSSDLLLRLSSRFQLLERSGLKSWRRQAVSLWNQPDRTPEGSRLLQQFRVHIKSGNSRSSNRCPTDQSFPVPAPGEMFFPDIRARVKEGCSLAGARISGFSPTALGDVAMGASQA